MYFWNLKGLKEDLAGPGLSEKESFKYFLTYAIGASVSSTTGGFGESPGKMFASLIVGVILTLASVIYSYQMNGAAHGKDFLKTYLSINWVIGFRVVVIGMPIVIAAAIILSGLYEPPKRSGVGMVFMGIPFALIFIAIAGAQIKDVARKRQST